MTNDQTGDQVKKKLGALTKEQLSLRMLKHMTEYYDQFKTPIKLSLIVGMYNKTARHNGIDIRALVVELEDKEIIITKMNERGARLVKSTGKMEKEFPEPINPNKRLPVHNDFPLLGARFDELRAQGMSYEEALDKSDEEFNAGKHGHPQAHLFASGQLKPWVRPAK